MVPGDPGGRHRRNLLPGDSALGSVPAINAGVHPKVIQAFLGHKDARSTARYAHLRTDTLKEFWDKPQSSPDTLGANGKVVNFKGKEG